MSSGAPNLTLPSSAPAITIEQYLLFKAPLGFRDELIEGEIVLSPDPKALHQEVAYKLASLLEREVKGTPYVVRQRTNMQMSQDNSMPSPDVFVLDAKRWRAAVQQNGYPQQSPQLVVEVISRSNTKKNIHRKIALYLRNGASAVWIVHPISKVIEVFHSPEELTIFRLGDSIPLPSLFQQGLLTVAEVFDLT